MAYVCEETPTSSCDASVALSPASDIAIRACASSVTSVTVPTQPAGTPLMPGKLLDLTWTIRGGKTRAIAARPGNVISESSIESLGSSEMRPDGIEHSMISDRSLAKDIFWEPDP